MYPKPKYYVQEKLHPNFALIECHSQCFPY